MNKLAILGASLALTACATPAQKLAADLDSKLQAMVGQPVEIAFDRLGEPSGSARIGSDTVYGWQQAFASKVTTGAFGVGSPSGVYAPVYYGSSRTRFVDSQCLVQAVVGPDGLIRYWHFEGDYAGCHPYAERLVQVAQAGGE